MARRVKAYTSQYRDALAAKQGHACAYCRNPFGSAVRAKGEIQALRVEVDHALPVIWTDQEIDAGNAVAACQLCNRVKGSKLFPDTTAARSEILEAWERKRYEVVYQPPVASTENPEIWARGYARWISGSL